MVNKITDFGYNFQIKTIVCLMRDVKFIEQIHDILDEKHFDNEAIKWIVKNCKEYYNEYKTNVTMDVFKIKDALKSVFYFKIINIIYLKYKIETHHLVFLLIII